MITLHTLASGSEGNTALFSSGATHLLVDAGISARRIKLSLSSLGLSPAGLTAILITHEHADHVSGLRVLLKGLSVPVYASAATCQVLADKIPGIAPHLQEVLPQIPFSLGGVTVTPFSTSHDAAGSLGFRMDEGACSVGLLTDTGFVTPEARHVLPGVQLLLLESNHDVEHLLSGPYPYSLKQRILGPLGHLSNEDAAAFARQMAACGLRQVVLAHLSRENNSPAMARFAAEQALQLGGFSVPVSVAPRGECSPCYFVEEEACRR